MSSVDEKSMRSVPGIAALLFAALAAFGIDSRAGSDVASAAQSHTQTKFTVSEGTWMSVDVSPDGKSLLFDLLGDIYSLPATGGDAKLIFGGPAMEHSPRFSPDGSKILYISDRSGSDNLWSANIDGSASRQITRETVNTLGAPAWDAQGQYAAATKFSIEMSKLLAAELWLYHLDGGQGRIVVAAPANGKAVHEPQFSHDGRYLYYTENIAPPGPSLTFVNANQPVFAIKRRRLSDGKVEEVVSGFGGATSAQLSPDDTRMAFVRRVKDKTVLFVYDLQTGEQRPIHDGLDHDLRANWNPRAGSYYPQYGWFPDSRHLAIWSAGKLYRIDTQTRAREEIPFRVTVEHQITIPPRFDHALAPERFTARVFQQIAVAPDGKSVTFNALGHLWKKSLPAGAAQRLTKADDFEFEPSYSADGTHLVYVSWNDERGGALELASAAGRRVKTLLSGRSIIRQPSFSPDGKRVVYWLEQGNRELGGYRVKAGLYWMSIADAQPHYVGPGGMNPQFSPDGTRIYYVARVTGMHGLGTGNSLESVDLAGLDKRQHAVGPDVEELSISPDLRWLAYRKDLQYYVIPYREIGTALTLTKYAEPMPAMQLTEGGGSAMVWSADSRQLHWLLGPTLFTAQIGAPGGEPVVTQTTIELEMSADKPQGTVAFVNGRVITMRGEEVIERGTVVVEENRIAAVGPVERVEIPEHAKVIDVAGKTLMPGLVDMHGHLEALAVDEPLMPQKHPSHYAQLAFGVTTNFDPSSTRASLARAEMNLAGISVGPRLISTGRIIYGMTFPGMFHPIASLDDARKIIAQKKAAGAIIVKSYMQPMRSQRQQLIQAAREARMMVTPEGEGHFYNNLTMILDGHVSVEHGIAVANYYDDLIQLIAHSGTSLTPTLIVSNGAEDYFYQATRPWDDPKVKAYVQKTASDYSPIGSAPEAPPYARGMLGLYRAEELWDVEFRSIARALKKLDDAGGVVNVGAHGQIQGLGMHWEMWTLAEGGMSNHRILRAATLNGARTIGLEQQIGTLEPGKLADLIVLDANPLENIRNTNTVRYTMVNGRLYDSLGMNEIGNYDRPRGKFYWELDDHRGIDWNTAWGGAGIHTE